MKNLPAAERKTIGDAIRAVRLGWPVGMPLVHRLQADWWEVRVRLGERVVPVLLHGFVEK